MASRLDSSHNDWAEAKVKAGFESSKEVNSVLLKERDVPPMPEQDRVIRSVQAVLKPEQVNFMMAADQGERPAFTYQGKLVAPSNRIDLVTGLIDKQPKRMGTADQAQQDTWIWGPAEQHLIGRRSRVDKPTWYWELGQGEQVLETPQQGDDSRLVIGERAREFLRNLPRGMRGTDRFTWATRMATGMREGRPLDIRFKGSATNTTEYDLWNFAPLDEEGEFVGDGARFLVGGAFGPGDRYADLVRCNAEVQGAGARFRAAVDGTIET